MTTPTNLEPLAIDGGEPVRTEPLPLGPHGIADVGDEEIAAVTKVLRRQKIFRYLGRTDEEGPSESAQLEQAFCEFTGCQYAIGTTGGTTALIAGLVGIGVGVGDEVIIPAYTYIATPAACLVVGAIPVIAEIDESMTLDPEDVAGKITEHTRAILPVHMRGMACNMDAIMELARKHDLKVIEDCAQADGGLYKGKRLGTIGDVGCFSFDFYKLMATGEGGMLVTSDEHTYMRAQSYHDTAACWRPDRYARERMAGELFCGENYRMSELQGAVGLAQIRKLYGIVRGLISAKKRVRSGLQPSDALRPSRDNDPDDGAGGLIMIAKDTATARTAMEALKAEGVNAGGIFNDQVRDWHIYSNWEHILEQKSATEEGCPFTCPYYKGRLPDYSTTMCPRTSDLLTRSFGVPLGPTWTDEECGQVADAINKVARALDA